MADDTSWSVTLPALDGQFKTPASLLRSFSLVSLTSKLFRSSPLPTPAQLDPLFAAAPGDPPAPALALLSTYVAQLKAAAPTRAAADAHLALVLRAYLHGVRLCAAAPAPDAALDAAQRQCLEGVFIARSLIRDGTDADLALLHTVTPPSALPDPHDQLQPVLERARTLAAALKQSARATPAASKAAPPPGPGADEREVRAALDVLDTLVAGVAAIAHIDGVRPVKTKKDKEAAACRPQRVAIECRLAGCDLALSMATATIRQVKRRALSAAREGRETPGTASSHRESTDGGDPEDGTEWEVLAERRLLECLTAATELVDHDRTHVLDDEVVTALFTGEIPPARSPAPPSSSGGSSSGAELVASDDSESEADGPTHACPLRTLFELHDRFEEQRLAVWMALPSDTRAKMGSFMRGTGGAIGAKWDDLGLGIMRDLDSDALLAYGLGPDQLDKWLELAARRNARRVRRRR